LRRADTGTLALTRGRADRSIAENTRSSSICAVTVLTVPELFDKWNQNAKGEDT
jgi:hypothetical protein